MYKYCIARREGRIYSFLLDEKDHTVELHCDQPESAVTLGNIYVGRVKNVAKNLQAAFVEIQPGLICYLPLEQLKHPIFTRKGSSPKLQQGDELIVQVSREAIKSKAPSVTSELCISGKYVLLDMGRPGIGVSRKLAPEARERLKVLGQERGIEILEAVFFQTQIQEFLPGIVLRTNAVNAAEEQILEELRSLADRLYQLLTTGSYRTCFSCLYEQPPQWLRRLKGLPYDSVSKIILEDEALYEQTEAYLRQENRELYPGLSRYQDNLLPLDKLYSLEHRIGEALGERVWMNSGAYLVIQPTEALTVIDVNTGKSETGKKKEEAILKINLEAARETARQLRLRNLSGIIIVDFINMKTEESRQQLLHELETCLRKDPVPAHAVDMTKLYLVEITRKKVEKPLREQVKEKGVTL